MPTNNNRDSRIVTQKSLTTDYTLSLLKVDDGKLKITNNLTQIGDVNDINNGILRKVDYMDQLPSTTSGSSLFVNLGYPGRTVVYTGETNESYQKGCMYQALPITSVVFSSLGVGNNTNFIKFVSSAAYASTITDGAYMVISNVDGNPRAIIYTGGGKIKFATGCGSIAEAANANSIILYDLVDGNLVRRAEVNEYVCNFNGCVVSSYSDLATPCLQLVIKGFTGSSITDDNFTWALVSQQPESSISVFDTIRPVNNICVLNTSPTCHYFGEINSSLTSIDVILDLTKLAPGSYYNTNVLVMTVTGKLVINFIGKRNDVVTSTQTSTVDAGVYKIEIEYLPNGTIITNVVKASSVTDESTTGYMYGIRYSVPASGVAQIERVTLTRMLDANYNTVEEYHVLSASDTFTSLPCHELKRCVMKNFLSGKPEYYLYKANSLRKEDGTYADLTGKDGDVVVECPKMYVRITQSVASGFTYFIISDKTIPDPPSTSNEIVLFNGPHPFFRVGGTLELDGDGNEQYEKRYDSVSGQLVDTDVVLRMAKPKVYVGAFQSVRAHQSTTGMTAQTIKASATATGTTSDYVTPSGSFKDYKNYPRIAPGVAEGNVMSDDGTPGCAAKVVSLSNTMARSIAPYRDGKLVYVGYPGVRLVLHTSDVSKPVHMPGGCDAVFSNYTDADYSYKVTTDTVFNENTIYFTKTQDNEYVRADVTPGAAIHETYYVRYFAVNLDYVYSWNHTIEEGGVDTTYTYTISYNTSSHYWELKRGNVLMGHSSVTAVATSFSNLTWTIESSELTGATLTAFSTSDDIGEVTVGPINYGTRNSSFNWSNQTAWDKSLAGNPNWALNYRPITSLPRTHLHQMHGAGYTSETDFYYAHTNITGVMKNDAKYYNIFSFANAGKECQFEFAGAARTDAPNPISTNIWYGINANGTRSNTYQLYFNTTLNNWVYTDGVNELVADITYDHTGKPSANHHIPAPFCQYIDKNNRYLTLYNPGYVREDALPNLTPDTPAFGTSSFICAENETSLNSTIKTYVYTEGNDTYTLSFDHGSLRWKIYKLTANGPEEMYRSNRLDPAAFKWHGDAIDPVDESNVPLNVDNTLVVHQSYHAGLNPFDDTQTTLRVGMVNSTYKIQSMLDLSLYDASAVTLNRYWTYSNQYKLQFYTSGNYANEWCLTNGNGSTVYRSTLDIIVRNVANGTSTPDNEIIFQPVNIANKEAQRTYNVLLDQITNTTLVYQNTLANEEATSRYYLIFFVDEKNQISSYFNNLSAARRIALMTMVNNFAGRWVMVEFTDATRLDIKTDSPYQTTTSPMAWSDPITEAGPWLPKLMFTPSPSNTTHKNNTGVLRVKNTVLLSFKETPSGSAYNANIRFRDYLSLLMLIEFGSFDMATVFSKGKTGIVNNRRKYATTTFAGRTAQYGNTTAEVSYDPEIDINIASSDFITTGSANRVVACSYRGIENPFGNIYEYSDGIISYRGTRAEAVSSINLDPASYNDRMIRLSRSAFYYEQDSSPGRIYSTENVSCEDYVKEETLLDEIGFVTELNPYNFRPSAVSLVPNVIGYFSSQYYLSLLDKKVNYYNVGPIYPCTFNTGNPFTGNTALPSMFNLFHIYADYGDDTLLLGGRLQY